MELNWMRLGNLGCVRNICYFQCKQKNECRDRWINVNMVLSMCVVSRLCMVNCRKIINDSKAFCTVLVAHMRLLSRPVKPQKKNTTGWTFSQTRLTPKEKTSTPDWIASSNHTHTSIAIATIAAILIKKYNESKAITTTTTKKKNRRKIANCIFIRVIVVAYANGAS